ncbi:hypothetical protein [Roseibium aquae]|nr:hypothetical protein [Roseibium aquae]
MPIVKNKTEARQANSEKENARVLTISLGLAAIVIAAIAVLWFV